MLLTDKCLYSTVISAGKPDVSSVSQTQNAKTTRPHPKDPRGCLEAPGNTWKHLEAPGVGQTTYAPKAFALTR